MADQSFGYNLALLLGNQASINAICGTRITPKPLPPGTANDPFEPRITYQQIAGRDLESLQGYSGMVETIFQLDCWAKLHEDADMLRRVVKEFLRFYKGPSGGVSAGDIPIAGSNHAGDREFYDGERRLYQKITSFRIWWELD